MFTSGRDCESITTATTSIICLITNINLSGLHPIESFMRSVNDMFFMKSGKGLASPFNRRLSPR